MNIKLTEKQMKNLFMFLERTTLKGSEVMIFLELIKILNNAKNEEVGEKSEN